MDGPLLSHCMVDGKSARRCSSRFFDNFEYRSRNSIVCADNPNAIRRGRIFGYYGLFRRENGRWLSLFDGEAPVVSSAGLVRQNAGVRDLVTTAHLSAERDQWTLQFAST
jgi:hypothetical protein